MTATPTIILLNGAGSAGKSSIARALQDCAARPLLHVEMDGFLAMLPARLENDPSTFAFVPGGTSAQPSVTVTAGPLGAQLMRGMRAAIRGLADTGLDLVVDDVLFGAADPGMAEYRQLLTPFDFRTVGVTARLETLEHRERQRGDRRLGLARAQIDHVHQGMDYDLTVHSDDRSPDDIAREIAAQFGL